MGTARIASLHCYPVKSAAGVDLERAQLTPAGIATDREWMVVTPAGRFLTQRELPRLALIRPAVTDDLVLTAPGLPALHVPLQLDGPRLPVVVWKDSCPGIDAGNDAAAWLTRCLERECRLVRFDPSHRRLSSLDWTGGREAENRFSDGYPLLVIGRASLEDLNGRLPKALPMNRFRPNLVIEGLGAFDEDRIDELSGDGVRLRLVKPCTRCKITTTEQSTGEPEGDEPLRTLKSFRFDPTLKGVLFGQNAIILEGCDATLHVGQALEVRWKP
ncbi:MAG TPA: MOSC N-terminal beta barrel domain-containing protein [Steroidobacteraceae bacterium]|nr:MOSC N-terminal beta barrel domain-containing protein [Steroidobacteraceae bacterium]